MRAPAAADVPQNGLLLSNPYPFTMLYLSLLLVILLAAQGLGRLHDPAPSLAVAVAMYLVHFVLPRRFDAHTERLGCLRHGLPLLAGMEHTMHNGVVADPPVLH